MRSPGREKASDNGEDEELGNHSESQSEPLSPSKTQTNHVDYPPTQLGSHPMASSFPYHDPYYGAMFSNIPYPPHSMFHLQFIHHSGLPLPTNTIEEPVFVNSKQYHCIMRRRQARAKAESLNRVIKSRKPYLHESRHLHALRRARGCGGRFANKKSDDEEKAGSNAQ